MSRVRIVTDSTSYLPAEIAARHDFGVVSLWVNEGGATTRESELTDLDAFYARLRGAHDLPTTSQPSPGDFLAVYEPLLAAGDDVVSIHITGGISGTIETARQAALEAVAAHPGRRVEVVDSDTAAGGLAMVLLGAAAVAESGGDLEAVVARAVEARGAQQIWFAVDTLDHLRRGGRIGAAQAWLGGALKIKPILTMKGVITPVERVRTSGRAFERLVEYAGTLEREGSGAWIVQHVQAPDDAARLAERCTAVFGHGPVLIAEIGPVVGAHVGPGLLGVGGLPGRLLAPVPG
jgi:DegV family protein with EDD domain